MRQFAIYLLFLLSGAAGLVYEVIWMRALRLVLGSSVEAASIVLATFLGGLAVGSFFGARLSRAGRPLKRYAAAELVVAATAMLVPLWLMAYRAIYPTVFGWAGDNATALGAFRLLMAVLAMGPPAIAMGTTLPLVTRAVVTEMDRFAWRTGLLYALNTFGAMAGALAAGFFLPVWLGIQGSMFLAAGLNVLVGVVAWILPGQMPLAPSSTSPKPADDAPPPAAPRLTMIIALLLLAALSGFGSLAWEVVYFRILSFHTEGSVYSFSLMLVFVLAFLALAAIWVARNLDRQDAWRFLANTQLTAVAVLLITPLVFHGLPYFAGYDADDTFVERMTRYAITSAVILGPSMLLIGVVLPCTWKIAASDVTRSGTTVGLLTGVNTLAAVAGSMATGFLLLPRLGLGLTSLAVTSVYAVIAGLAFLIGGRGLRRWLGPAAAAAMIVGWFWLGGWRVQLLEIKQGERLISYHDGPDATVLVLERPDGHRVLKVNHDYTLGSSLAADREARQARLPLMLHPDPRRVAFVGVATGMTVGAALEFPVERVAAIELLPGVADTLPLFSQWNGNVVEDPRVEIVVEDGRNFLAGTSEQFDVIVSDLFVPWHAGTGDLYSVEHFQTARKRLAPGGIFAQCLPGYQLSVEEIRTITASLLKAFPNSVLWRNDYNLEYPILCLTGFRDELSLDADAVRKHIARLRESESVSAKFLSDPDGLPLLFVCGPKELAEWSAGATLNTDDHPWIEFTSPRSYFIHKQTHIEPVHELLASIRSRSWPFDEEPSDKPAAELFQIADLVIEAQRAFSDNNFEREFRRVRELARLAGDSPSVAGYVLSVANRYRSRQMNERGVKLLSILAEFPEPPVPVLLALAQEDQFDGNDEQAIALMEQAVERAPHLLGPRKELVDMLERTSNYAEAEPHLYELIKSQPGDPYLRLDLARALHQQGKTDETRTAIDEFLASWDGSNSESVWRYLRTRGLGRYVDRFPMPQATTPVNSSEPDDADDAQTDSVERTNEVATGTDAAVSTGVAE